VADNLVAAEGFDLIGRAGLKETDEVLEESL
jgi:hypothetical protein